MTEQKNALAQLFAACWKDEALKARFMSDPKAVLKEHGLDVPDNLDVKVVENADDCVHITLPAPPAGDMDLSDHELSNAAGGTVAADDIRADIRQQGSAIMGVDGLDVTRNQQCR